MYTLLCTVAWIQQALICYDRSSYCLRKHSPPIKTAWIQIQRLDAYDLEAKEIDSVLCGGKHSVLG
jgi:hypothetical protein